MSPVEVIIAGVIGWVAVLALAVDLGPTICLSRKIYARVDRLDSKVDAFQRNSARTISNW